MKVIIIKKSKKLSIGKDVEKMESLCTIAGKANLYIHYGNQMKVPQKIENKIMTIDRSQFWLYIYRKESRYVKEMSASQYSLQHYSQQL